MQIEVWADVVCPWCFIGKRRLDRALRQRGIADEARIVHRAFQLNPQASDRHESALDHLAEKYGITLEQTLDMMSDVTEVAETEGLHYRLEDTLTGNTADAHRLALWAQHTSPGHAQPLLDAIYSAYFEQGRGIFTADDLAALADSVGLDPAAAREVLAETAYADQVVADQALAREFGANGVPFFVFDRTYGISGAQPFDVFLSAIDQAAEGGLAQPR